MNIPAEIIGLISGTLGLSVALPQLFKIIKAKNHVGVSIASWIIALGNFSLWAAYGFRYNSFSQIIANIVASLLTALLVYVLIKQRYNLFYALVSTLLTILVFFLYGTFSNTVFLTIMLFTMVLLGRIPQIIASYSSFIRNEVTNVSKLTYTLMISSSAGWVVYGFMTGLYHNIIASSVTIITSFTVLYYETRKREVPSKEFK